MERIEDKQRYLSKETIKQKLLQLLSKNLMWMPVILGVIGLFLFFRLYQQKHQGKQLPSVKYEELVDYQDYQKPTTTGNKLQHLQQKLMQEASENKKKRYERIIGGSDLVNVKYQDKLKTVVEDSVVEKQDSLAIAKEDSAFQNTEKEMKATSAIKPKVKTAKKSSVRKSAGITRQPMAQNESNSVDESTILPDTMVNGQVRQMQSENVINDSILKKGSGAFNLIVVDQTTGTSFREFVKVYVYGEQQLMQGSFLKLRLAEDLELENGHLIPRNTVFHGQVSLRSNIVEITIQQIRQHPVQLAVYDRDYSYGILLEPEKQQVANQSLYRTGSRSAADLPLDLAQDLTRALIQQERRKARVIKINDGYPLYIAKPLSK